MVGPSSGVVPQGAGHKQPQVAALWDPDLSGLGRYSHVKALSVCRQQYGGVTDAKATRPEGAGTFPVTFQLTVEAPRHQNAHAERTKGCTSRSQTRPSHHILRSAQVFSVCFSSVSELPRQKSLERWLWVVCHLIGAKSLPGP